MNTNFWIGSKLVRLALQLHIAESGLVVMQTIVNYKVGIATWKIHDILHTPSVENVRDWHILKCIPCVQARHWTLNVVQIRFTNACSFILLPDELPCCFRWITFCALLVLSPQWRKLGSSKYFLFNFNTRILSTYKFYSLKNFINVFINHLLKLIRPSLHLVKRHFSHPHGRCKTPFFDFLEIVQQLKFFGFWTVMFRQIE